MTTPSVRSTRFPELTVEGSPIEMGTAIGEQFRDTIRDLSELVLERFNKGSQSPVSMADAESIARAAIPYAEDYLPSAVEELKATGDAAGVSLDRMMLLNVRSMLSAPEGCTSVMVGADATASGTGMAGQNWDNDPAMDPFSVVITRKPTVKPAFMSFCQAGIIAYMGFNEAGIGLCMNALNGPSRRNGVGWYFLVRSIYEQTSLDGVIESLTTPERAMSANAAMITPQGPADLEITLDSVEVLRANPDETLVHTNHCVHPSLAAYNEEFGDRIYGQSFDRKTRAEELLGEIDGQVTIDHVKSILSDRQGYPTSINRFPNDDPATGWQRSVVSMIVEPAAGRMHLTRGNPGDNPYEVYDIG